MLKLLLGNLPDPPKTVLLHRVVVGGSCFLLISPSLLTPIYNFLVLLWMEREPGFQASPAPALLLRTCTVRRGGKHTR
jgi:hypothetical protein